jgi:hypothetical protein
VLPIEIDMFAGPFRLRDLAQIHVMLGDADMAVDTLRHLLSVPGEIHAPEIALDPIWAPLRSRADFQEVVNADPATATAPMRGHRSP